MKIYVAFALCAFLMLPAHTMGCLQRSYAYFLGNQDVSYQFKQQVRQALIDSGIASKDVDKVPVKQMNDKGSRIAGEKLKSFTALGLWFDEKSFDDSMTGCCTPTEKTFGIYHEAAHYKCKHHPKLVAACVLCFATCCAGICALRSSYIPTSSQKLQMIDGLGAFVVTLLSLPFMVKKQEKIADQYAARTLYEHQKQHIAENYLDSLSDKLRQQSGNTGWLSNIWWPSLKQQVAYLSDVRKDYK